MITLVSLLDNKQFEALLDETILPLVIKYGIISKEVNAFTKAFGRGYVAGYNSKFCESDITGY